MWYLTPKYAELSFLSADDIVFDRKKYMIQNLHNTRIEILTKKFVLKDIENYINTSVDNFISLEKCNFFNTFNIDISLL